MAALFDVGSSIEMAFEVEVVVDDACVEANFCRVVGLRNRCMEYFRRRNG